MKKCFAVFFSISLALLLLTACICVSAASSNGLDTKIETDKQKYNAGDEVVVTTTLENKSDKQFKNINVEFDVPNGFTVLDGEENPGVFNLLPNYSKTVTITYEIGEIYDNGGFLDEILQTGDKAIIYIALFIAVVSGVIVATLLLIKKKNKGLLSSMIIIFLAAILVCISPINTIAASNEQNMSVSKTVKVEGEKVELSAKISYIVSDAVENNDNEIDDTWILD